MIYIVILFLIFYGIIQFDIYKHKSGGLELYVTIVTFLILISGFAYRLGGDGLVYVLEYNTYSINDGFGWDSLNRYDNRLPGWVLLIKLCRIITVDYWFFKLIHAVILNILICKAIRRYTVYQFSGLLMYFVLMYFDFNFQILRQSLSIAIFLSSLPYFDKNQWIKYYLVIIIALSIHTSAIICLLFPLVKLVGYHKKELCIYIILLLLFIVFVDSILMAVLTSYTLDDSTAHLDYYLQQVEFGVGFSFFYNILLSLIIPFGFLYFINLDANNRIFLNKQYMIIVYGMIYTMGLYIPIFYRFNHYFILFFYLFYIDVFWKIASYFSNKIRFRTLRIGTGTFFIIMVLMFTTIKARFYFSPYGDTPYPTWVQYYPYSSVLLENKDSQREDFFEYLQ